MPICITAYQWQNLVTGKVGVSLLCTQNKNCADTILSEWNLNNPNAWRYVALEYWEGLSEDNLPYRDPVSKVYFKNLNGINLIERPRYDNLSFLSNLDKLSLESLKEAKEKIDQAITLATPKRMTLSDIEEVLGHRVEII